MMEGEFKYLEYVAEDFPYYQKPKPKESEEFSVQALDDHWVVSREDSFWAMYHLPDQMFIDQGWKIHVTTDFDQAEETLNIVSDHLIASKIAFKHVKDKQLLFGMYSKHGSRISAGKFITIYPDEDQFIPLMDELHERLSYLRKGPYILTDRAWKNSNVYYRYGGFKDIKNEAGESCIVAPDGKLIPDVRMPKFHVPDFVEIPDALKTADQAEISTNLEIENRLRLYKIEKAIRFSNAGGIYRATRKSDGKKCIIKEARSHIGLDGNKHTAVCRLQVEYEALKKLEGVKGVVKALDYFVVWDHTFLVLEFVEGENLHAWVAKHYPFSSESNTHGYANKIQMIMNKLTKIIETIHQRDIAMCDLQTQNVMVNEQLEVKIIDFETAEDAYSESEAAMGAKGFYHSANKRAKDRDWYSLNRIYQFCLLPIGAVYDLDMRINTKHCIWIYRHFGKAIYHHFYSFQVGCREHIIKFDEIFGDTYAQAKELITKDKLTEQVNVQSVMDQLKNSLLANCNENSNSLINGDIRQFEMDGGMINLQNGGFGAVLTLLRINSLNEKILSWVNHQLPTLFLSEYNEGFLTGRSGIACTLYECGYQREAVQLMNLVVGSYSKNTSDISLRSGLSGIGMAFIAMYQKVRRERYLTEAKEIAKILVQKVEDGEEIKGTDWESVSLGLLDGYSGASIFFTLLYSVTKEEDHLKAAVTALQKDIDHSLKSDDGTLQVYDAAHNRLLPYLSNGGVGIGVAITVLNRVSQGAYFIEELVNISKLTDLKVSIEPGFLDGLSGLLVANAFQECDITLETLSKLSLYFIEHEDKLLFPGRMFYKLSSDLHTGVAGVLLSILSAQTKNPLFWLPLVHELIEDKSMGKVA